jgi:predicted nucleic acid-binding protein
MPWNMMILYYVDSSVWLNLFKKEKNQINNIPYWKIAKDFIEKVSKDSDSKIIVSTIILKELSFILKDKFVLAKKFLESSDYVRLIKTISTDYNLAREIELETSSVISFYDCLHIVISKRLNCILVTRDNQLIETARGYLNANKPENLIA